MARSSRRYGLQSRVFASDPWNVIESVVYKDCPSAAKPLALAYLEQSRDFFSASQLGSVRPAKPLLIYYSFMNLVKAFALTAKIVTTFGESYHGLRTKFPAAGSGPIGVKLQAFPSNSKTANLFDLLLRCLTGTGLTQNIDYELDRLLPQILLGHRLWCAAAGRKERFIEIERLQFLDDRTRKNCWIQFDILKSEFSRLGYTQAQIRDGSRLQANWRIVSAPLDPEPCLRFEGLKTTAYASRPSDVLNELVASMRHSFWRSVTIVRPFRKYYVYVADPKDLIIPQICSIYAVFFYLGSITRYRPDQFGHLVAGPYGAFVQEFIENQPNQWLYLFASEFAKQEVTRAAVV